MFSRHVLSPVTKDAPKKRGAPPISKYSGWLESLPLSGARVFQVLGAIAWEGKGQAFGVPVADLVLLWGAFD